MEFRQLRYFVTLAEELHFGRAAAREHIVQSALSQQLQRLERELGVPLLERTTHHVQLNAAGAAFLIEARQILAHVDRAAVAAQQAAHATPSLRVGIVDASYDSMPLILHDVQQHYPDLEIHQVELGVPDQFQRLVDGRLDVGLGRASLAPPAVASDARTTGRRPRRPRRVPGGSGPSGSPWSARRGCARWSASSCARAGPRPRLRRRPTTVQFDSPCGRKIVRELILRKSGVEMTPQGIGKLLRRMGLSPQRPLYRAYQRDPEAVRRWKDEEFRRSGAAASRDC
jgi:DNA-binding transcriptional LysR family regulator